MIKYYSAKDGWTQEELLSLTSDGGKRQAGLRIRTDDNYHFVLERVGGFVIQRCFPKLPDKRMVTLYEVYPPLEPLDEMLQRRQKQLGFGVQGKGKYESRANG